jgi:hypothetical protein
MQTHSIAETRQEANTFTRMLAPDLALPNSVVRALLTAAIRVEAVMRDELDLVSAEFCEICNTAAFIGDDDELYADIQHDPDCAYDNLRDAITAVTQRGRR